MLYVCMYVPLVLKRAKHYLGISQLIQTLNPIRILNKMLWCGSTPKIKRGICLWNPHITLFIFESTGDGNEAAAAAYSQWQLPNMRLFSFDIILIYSLALVPFRSVRPSVCSIGGRWWECNWCGICCVCKRKDNKNGWILFNTTAFSQILCECAHWYGRLGNIFVDYSVLILITGFSKNQSTILLD